MDNFKYYQVGATHYNLDQIVSFTSSIDLKSVLVRFSDGSDHEFTFDNESEYSEFIYMMRNIKF